VSPWLQTSQGPWQRTKTFDTKSDTNTFVLIVAVIESKSKMNLAPPEELDLWVKQNYLTMEEAVAAFPFYAAQLDADRKSRVPVDWALIEEEYSDDSGVTFDSCPIYSVSIS